MREAQTFQTTRIPPYLCDLPENARSPKPQTQTMKPNKSKTLSQDSKPEATLKPQTLVNAKRRPSKEIPKEPENLQLKGKPEQPQTLPKPCRGDTNPQCRCTLDLPTSSCCHHRPEVTSAYSERTTAEGYLASRPQFGRGGKPYFLLLSTTEGSECRQLWSEAYSAKRMKGT